MSSGLQPLGGGLTPMGGGEEKKETPPAPPAAPAPTGPVTPPGAPRTAVPAPNTRDFYRDEEDAGRRRLPWLIGAGVLVAASIVFALLRPLGPAALPTGTTPFLAADQAFACDIPTNWDKTPLGTAAEGGQTTTSPGVRVTSGGGTMEVTFSTVRGLMTGQLLFGNELTPGSMQGQSNALAVANLQKKGVRKRLAGYQETKQPACPSGMGAMIIGESKTFVADAVLYEFTAQGAGLHQRGAIHGYRAVVAGATLIGAVLCWCDESDWPKLKPEFLKFIGSIKEARPSQPKSMLGTSGSLGGGGY
ncbi:hypothetical protein [Armatimonas rosea]|uniref:Uncharacterized protein n=1 Tax=Armatimonas rosea TaxID=685828 RepID=A0A7W9SSU0_ARMRO|nr:hypothetical protein [Armatimonas rosea]MBB6051403.1 hypothetical protein [Armatimonas rosea]